MEQNGIETIVKIGKVAERVLNGMRLVAGALASSGNNLIIDEVIFGNKNNGSSNPLLEYQAHLKPYNFRLVGVFVKLEFLERRERERGDRAKGLSRWQYERVHEGTNYDFSVHTDNSSSLECAEQIKSNFNL